MVHGISDGTASSLEPEALMNHRLARSYASACKAFQVGSTPILAHKAPKLLHAGDVGERVSKSLGPGRQAYLVVAAGKIEVDGEVMEALDGAVILGVESTVITAVRDAELVMLAAAGVAWQTDETKPLISGFFFIDDVIPGSLGRPAWRRNLRGSAG